MLDLLRWLKYFVDTCEANNIVRGVGRGSSVASYVLYVLGVHQVDSVKYNLDWQEFLR
jgi:DNA polymerase III alpha subunit